jgi:enterochelin esterase-like enzyme
VSGSGRPERRSGELVTQRFAYDGGREVTVYAPATRPEAIVFAGDGRTLARWGASAAGPGLPATMVVGIHPAAEKTRRLHEYSPGFDPELFAAHESLVLDDVRPWVRTRFGVELPAARTAMLGVSAGGELALALALRHPEAFGVVLGASVGAGYRPPEPMPAVLPRAYLVAGTGEPFFLANTTRWATALRAAGAEVVLRERAGGHGDGFARQELPQMLAWAFGS